MIIYLHGFRSSPRSFKARLLAAALDARGQAQRWHCPQLPVSPRESIALVERLMAGSEPQAVTLIGSSLGGYYATWLAERHGCRAALLNPATEPAEDLDRYLGEQALWHGGGSIIVEPHHLSELRDYAVAGITRPERYYLLATTGDEVLDYRRMLDKYRGVETTLIEGGDHGISDFAAHLARVLDFCDRHADPACPAPAALA